MPSEFEIRQCLRRFVKQEYETKAWLSIVTIRGLAEKEIELNEGFFTNDSRWRFKSRVIIDEASDHPSEIDTTTSSPEQPSSQDPSSIGSDDAASEASETVNTPSLKRSSHPDASKAISLASSGAFEIARSQAIPSQDEGDYAAKSERCCLLGLPLELQVMVFKMAYIKAETVLRTVSIGGWAEHDLNNRYGLWISAFPELQVERFLVSREFFNVAAKVYVENQCIALDASRIESGRTLAEQPRSVLCKWLTRMFLGQWLYGRLEHLAGNTFPALKWLGVEVNPASICPGALTRSGQQNRLGSFKEGDVLAELLDDDTSTTAPLSQISASCAAFLASSCTHRRIR